MKTNSNKAFTLIELLVVIAIIGILASVVLVSLQGAKDSAELAEAQSFARQVRTSLGLSLVGEWRLNDGAGNSAVESSGYGNNGTWSGTGVSGTHWTTDGMYDGAALFNGSDDYIELTNNDSSLTFSESFTISAWVKSSDSNTGPIIYKNQNGAGSDNRDNYDLSISSSNKFVFHMENGSNDDDYSVASLTTAVNGTWYYVVGVYDQSAMKIYVNGILENVNNTGSFTPYTGSGNAQLGSNSLSNHGTISYFEGVIDEVRIYNQPLSLTEIQQLFAQREAKYKIGYEH